MTVSPPPPSEILYLGLQDFCPPDELNPEWKQRFTTCRWRPAGEALPTADGIRTHEQPKQTETWWQPRFPKKESNEDHEK
jgi:hypothetical protein